MTGIFWLTLGLGCFVMSYVGRDRWQSQRIKSGWSILKNGAFSFNGFWLAYFGVIMFLGLIVAALAYVACATYDPVDGLVGCGPPGVWGSVELVLFTFFAFASPGISFGLFSTPEDANGDPVDLGISGPSGYAVTIQNGQGAPPSYAYVNTGGVAVVRLGSRCPECNHYILAPVASCPFCSQMFCFRSDHEAK